MSNTQQSASFLDQRLNQIYDHLYANAPVRTPSGISFEITKILRTIFYLEQSNNKYNNINELRLTNKLPLKAEPNYINLIVKNIHEAFEDMNKKYELYSESEKIKLSNFDLYYVYSKLNNIFISDPEKDVFGDSMEVFRSNWAKSHGGQFFTDQKVTHLAVILLQYNPLKGDDLVDICAGTGGFLLAGLNHLRNLLKDNQSLEKEKLIEELAKKSIKGQEIDKDVCEVANITLASRMGTKGIHLIEEGNSVLPEAFDPNVNSHINYNSHLSVATNPPFGTKITIKDPSILSRYELAHTYNKKRLQIELISVGRLSPRAPDILFLEQNIKLLKPGEGRLAIVIPFQIASGPQTFFIREWLLKNAEILAIVDLPPETFQPYTGTKTSLLVVKRRKKPLYSIDLSNDHKIFMSVPKWIGHDRRGNPTYKRLVDGSFSEEALTDFPNVEESYEAFLNGNDPSKVFSESFSIPAINLTLSPDYRIDARYHKSHQEIQSSTLSHSKSNNKWRLVKIKDVVSKIFYPGRFTRNYVEDPNNSIPFLGGTNITQLLLVTDKRLSITNPKLDELKVKEGWILITRSGSTGIVSSVPPAWNGYAISEHVIRIIPDPNKLSGEYLYAYLRSKYGQERLSQGVYGSVIDEITPEFIGDIEIPIPVSNGDLNKIIDSVQQGEKARQTAIESLNKAIEDIENHLSLV